MATCGRTWKGAWLGEDMTAAYTQLFHQGFAASVEVWKDDELVGGLYGVTLGKLFLRRKHVFPGSQCFQGGSH